jgi:hypothetical protein
MAVSDAREQLINLAREADVSPCSVFRISLRYAAERLRDRAFDYASDGMKWKAGDIINDAEWLERRSEEGAGDEVV